MEKRTRLIVSLIVMLLVGTGFIFTGLVYANESRAAFTISHSVIGSGGLGGSAGSYTLTSTLGQPVAGSVSGGDFTLTSGFWGQALMEWIDTFLPLILR